MRSIPCALLVVALVAAGCGDGGRLTPREFRREASRICRQGNARAQRVDVPPLRDAAAAAREIRRVVATQRSSLRELRDLRPPKDDAMTVEMWLAVVDQLLDEADAVKDALHAHDIVRAREAAGRAAVLDDRARTLASHFGIAPCRVSAESLGA